MSNGNHLSISHRVGDICTRKFILHHWAKIFQRPTPQRPPNPEAIFHPWIQGKSSMENEIDLLNTF